MIAHVSKFLAAEDGPTAVEYAIMLAMILMAVMGSISVIGILTMDSLNYSSSEIERTFPDM
ncbi:MAG: Flp family type IVb pilin [Pirellulaceae bacterium]